MRRALAIGVAALMVAAVTPAQAADPTATGIAALGARLTKLEKRMATLAARRGAGGAGGAAGAPGSVGARGPAGDTGGVGDPGPRGVFPSNETVPTGALGTSSVSIVGIALTDTLSRSYVFRANAVFTNTAAQPATVTCGLKHWFLGNVFDVATAKLGPAGSSDTRTLSLVSPFGAGASFFFTWQLRCSAAGVPPGSVTFADADIIAIEVDRVLGNVNRS